MSARWEMLLIGWYVVCANVLLAIMLSAWGVLQQRRRAIQRRAEAGWRERLAVWRALHETGRQDRNT